MFLCWGFYVSIFFFSRVQLLVEAFAVRAALKSQIISASGSLWYQRLSIWLFSCHLKCFQFFKCLVRVGCILDLLNVMRCLLLFKSYWECWYFDISRRTALLVSCHSFNLPSACCGSRAAKLFKPLQPCSALPHLGLAQWSVWGLDGRLCPVLITFGILTGNRSTELQIRGRAQEFTNNLEFVFPHVSLFVLPLILHLPRTPFLVLQSETGGLLCHALSSVLLCLGPNGRTERKKRNKEVPPHPVGITVLPVGEEGSPHSGF